MGDSSGEEEEEEYEYEEVEVEEEEEEEEENEDDVEYEEVEEEEEEEEEVEEEPEKKEEGEPEEEPEEEEEEEEYEEIEEEIEEEVEEEDVIEEEEEEYEEIEVTDEEEEEEENLDDGGDNGVNDVDVAGGIQDGDIGGGGGGGDSNEVVVGVVQLEAKHGGGGGGGGDFAGGGGGESVVFVGGEIEDVEMEEVVNYDPPFGSIAHQLHSDVRLDEESKENDVCSISRPQDSVNIEVAPLLHDIRAVEAIGSMLGSLSPSQQSRKGKEVLSIDDGSSILPESLDPVAISRKLGDDIVEGEQVLVNICPLAASGKDQQIHVEHLTPATTSEKHVSPLDDTHGNLCKFVTTDIDETGVPGLKEDLHLPSGEKMLQKELRSYTPQMRPRSLSPGAESEVVSKRPAFLCEFFMKGWCIKGSNCRFLHIRDQVDDAREQVKGDMLSNKAEICPGEGSGDAAGASKSPVHDQPKFLSDDLLPISATGRYTEKDHREPVHNKDKFRLLERDFLHPRLSISAQRSPSSKDDSKVAPSPNEAMLDIFKGNRPSDNLDHNGSSVPFGRSTMHGNFTPDHGFLQRGMGVTSGTPMNYSLDSYSLVEESIAMRRQYTMDLHSSPIRGFSSRSSNYLRNASLLDNSSLKDLLISYKNKRRFTPYNWEPSAPFRPSHCISSFTTPSSDVQYDPLRDSIDQPDKGNGSFRHSSHGQSQTQGLVYQQAQSIFRRNSMESHKILHSDSSYKGNYSHEAHDKNARVVEAESAAISATVAENKITTSDEENVMVGVSVKDILKATKSISDGSSSKSKIDDLRHKGEMGRQTKEVEEEGAMVIKIFRTALIEFVKELMKPVWHEGRLSKDVYKVIVQKAEDKILSTMPSNEVPNTPESIKLYLSSSRPKILKLIQAYVDKYGKF